MLSLQSRVVMFLRKNAKNEGARGMATLKAISMRLKSVKNIKKITQSMKMVSAAKLTRAEKELKQVKPLGEGVKLFYKQIETEKESTPEEISKKKILYFAVTSDRGLCGAVHSSVAKIIRNSLNDLKDPGEDIKIICIGDKSRSLLQRTFREHFLFVCQEVGRVPPTFKDASAIASALLKSGFEFEIARVVYNRFRSVVSYSTEFVQFYDVATITDSNAVKKFDEIDSETLLSYIEFSMVSLIFYTMKEGACSEQSSRMTAMDNASKNASDMIDKLTLSFNRTRQAVITRELIEIISGASAL